MMQEEDNQAKLQLDSINGCLKELVRNETSNKAKKDKRQRRYSEQIQKFALTTFFYSPRTYAYLRKVFTLPNPSTLRRWLRTVDCQPGFFDDVLKLIKPSIDSRGNTTSTETYYNLVIDSMAIRRKLTVNRTTGKVSGGVTIGNSDDIATEALLFLLVPLCGGGKRYPIGYFLVNKINASSQAQLIKQCLILTADYSLKVLNITFDGCSTNVSTAVKLKATLPLQNFFKHPTSDYQVTSLCTIIAIIISI